MVRPVSQNVKDGSPARDFVYFLAVFTILIYYAVSGETLSGVNEKQAIFSSQKIMRTDKMGKGDKKTRRGKIWRGSYGKCRRPHNAKKASSEKKMS
jgi:ribosomal small subunit protein bTHX